MKHIVSVMFLHHLPLITPLQVEAQADILINGREVHLLEDHGQMSEQTPLHIILGALNTPGEYFFHAIITDDCGRILKLIPRQITIDDPPNADAGNDINVCEGGTINLAATSVAGASYSSGRVPMVLMLREELKQLIMQMPAMMAIIR